MVEWRKSAGQWTDGRIGGEEKNLEETWAVKLNSGGTAVANLARR